MSKFFENDLDWSPRHKSLCNVKFSNGLLHADDFKLNKEIKNENDCYNKLLFNVKM